MFNQLKPSATVLLVCALLASGVSLAKDIRFAIDRYQVEGNSLLAPQAIEKTLKPFTGSQRQFDDVQQALEALQKHYQQEGFGAVLISIPEQELTGGVIRLKVIEPVLNNISVLYQDQQGNDYFPEDNIRSALPELTKGATPNTSKIAQNIQLANENPAREIETVLSVDKDPRLIDAKVKVKATPSRKAFMTFDNTGTKTSGEYRTGFGFQHANMFNRDHVFTLNYITPPEKAGEVNLYSLSYRLPLYKLGDSIDFIAARSDVGASTTQTVAGPLQFAGSGDVLGLHYNYLFPRWGEYTHRLTTGIDYRAFNNSCTLGAFGSAGCGSGAASVTLLPVSLNYMGNWQHPGQSLNFFMTALHNIPGLPNGERANFQAVRPSPVANQGAPEDYYALRFGASFIQAAFGDWQLKFTGNAQYTSDPLVYAEQFGLAGTATVRGFWEREVTRDMGYVLNSEVYTPNLAKVVGFAHTLRGMAFFDYGSGRNNTLIGESSQPIALTSVGVGLRLGFTNSMQLKFDGAYVLDGATDHRSGDARAHISIYMPYSF